MEPRFDMATTDPAALKGMLEMEKYLGACSLERNLIHLVKLHASEINHCAYCIDMHWKDLRAAGETEQRLYGLPAWRESPYYSDRERAALLWTEAVTLLTDGFVPDEAYDTVRAHFSVKEIAELTTAIVAINGWNRFMVAQRATAGGYQPRRI